MNILVTGGTGYIGEYFIPQLLQCGHKVRLLVRNIDKAKKIFGENCEYWIGDVTIPDSIKGCGEGIDIVYHMVAKVGNQLPSSENFKIFRAVNVEGTKNIIAECTEIKKFIFVSSIAAMGIVNESPINERSKCSPYLPYQVTKYEAEQYILEKIKVGFPAIIIRPTKVYGAGEHEYSYLTFAKLCKKGIFLKVGNGHNYTSNIYITDFVQALVKLVDKGIIGETYILSSNEAIDFIEIGKVIADILGKKIRIVRVPSRLMIIAAAIEEKMFIAINKKPIVTKRNIEATIVDRIYDINKAKNELEYNPLISMKDGIRQTVNWYINSGLL